MSNISEQTLKTKPEYPLKAPSVGGRGAATGPGGEALPITWRGSGRQGPGADLWEPDGMGIDSKSATL